MKKKDEFIDKALPNAEEAEKVILGAILLNDHLLSEAAAVLTPGDFYNSKYRRIFAAMIHCKESGQAVDPIMIGEALKAEGSLEAVGGVTSVTNLTFGLPQFKDIAEYIKLVKTKATAREVIRQCNQIAGTLMAEDLPVDKVIADSASAFINLQANAGERAETLKEVADHVRVMFDAWSGGHDNISSLKTGIPEVDGYLKLKGLAKGELTLIGARPSTGKTALILQIATQVVRSGVPVLFVSLEMLKERLVMRMLPPVSQVANKAINPATFKHQPEVAQQLRDALNSIAYLPMYFDRSSDLKKLLAKAEYYIHTKGVEMVVFDYLTLIKAGVISRRQDTRDAEVGMITTELKELAMRTNTVLLGAAQMNRESESGYGKPKMSGFRESGVIEQAVDVALFPYDPFAKDNAKNPDAVKDKIFLELYCDKQRDGARGWSVPITFDKNLQTMESPQMNGIEPPPRPTPRPASKPAQAPAPGYDYRRAQAEPELRSEDEPDF